MSAHEPEEVILIDAGQAAVAPCMEHFRSAHSGLAPALLIVPGGGYRGVSYEIEGLAYARRFVALGFSCFVLRYRAGDGCGRRPLDDLSLAVRSLRRQADRLEILADRIVVCGSSAGGHLAASLGGRWSELDAASTARGISCRPDALLLCYPVITGLKPWAHENSLMTFFGRAPSDEERLWFSCDKHVRPTFPPVFLWHTGTDEIVPVQNSMLLASALAECEVPFELHVFSEGPHALGVGTDYCVHGRTIASAAAGWPELAIAFLQRHLSPLKESP